MARRTINVDYLARVEGEGGVKLVIDGNTLRSVELRIFEPPRFFEAFLRGRSYLEAPDITARICGICSIGHTTAACLAVGEQGGGQFPDGLHIEIAERSSARVRNIARLRICAANGGVPHMPEFEQPPLLPFDVSTPAGILRVQRAREFQARGRLEVPAAVLAVAHARARPAVAEHAVHAIPRDDLSRNGRHEFEVIRTQRARDP